MPLEGQTVLVTGAASGIGAAIARRLASAGAIVRVAEVDRDQGEEVVSEIKEKGGRADFVVLDIREEASCAAAVKEGALDVLVNNARVGHVGTALETSPDDLDRLYAVNVRGVFNMSKAALPAMIRRQRGTIIDIASVAGLVGLCGRAAYTATKFAVVGLTKSMALDHAADGIRVNCICSARVETPFVRQRIQGYASSEKAYCEASATQRSGACAVPKKSQMLLFSWPGMKPLS